MVEKNVLVYSKKYLNFYEDLLERELPEARLLICDNDKEIEKYGMEAEIAFVDHNFPLELFKKMPRLKWIQVMAAGVENYFKNAKQFKDIMVCRIIGVHGRYMAEYVLAYVLYFCQNIGQVLKAQGERRWAPFLPEYLHKKTIGIMGLGFIGTIVAEKAKHMGMRVISWDLLEIEKPFLDQQYKANEMVDFLKEADFVVLTLPVTPKTVNIINRDVFRVMKKTSCLINIARGAIVDEKALVEALQSGAIASAVIDVYKQYPLPPESELWNCPNLILTPYISGPALPEDMVEFFKLNFQNYLRGEALMGVLNFDRGF